MTTSEMRAALEALADKIGERCGDHCCSNCRMCEARNDLRLILTRFRVALATPSVASPHEGRMCLNLARSLERLHFAIKSLARTKDGKTLFEHSPSKDAEAYSAWTDLDAAQKDAQVKLNGYRLYCQATTPVGEPGRTPEVAQPVAFSPDGKVVAIIWKGKAFHDWDWYGGPPAAPPAQGAPGTREAALEGLLVHLWIHADTLHSYEQMTTEQKKVWSEVISRSEQISERLAQPGAPTKEGA